jgi:long-chain acyl-CoA synthetase
MGSTGFTTFWHRVFEGEPRPELLAGCREESFRAVGTPEAARFVREFAAGLSAYGLATGDRVALVAAPEPESWLAELAVMAAGGVAVPIYRPMHEDGLRAVLAAARARYVLAGDPALLDQVLAVRFDLPDLELAFLAKAPLDGSTPAATLYDGLLARGRGQIGSDPSFSPRPVDGPALLTPRTESPDLAGFTGEELVTAAALLAAAVPLDPKADRLLVALPDGSEEQRSWLWAGMLQGVPSVCGSVGDGLREGLGRVRPTVLAADRAALEVLRHAVAAEAGSGSWPWRRLSSWALGRSARRLDADTRGESMGLAARWTDWAADLAILRRIRRPGGGRLRLAVCSGAPPFPETGRLLLAAGIPVRGGVGPAA